MDRARRTLRRIARLALVGLVACVAPPAARAAELPDRAAELPDRAADFGLLDHQGRFHRLHRQSHREAVVLFVQANGCDTVRASLPDLRALRHELAPRGVAFWMLNPIPGDERAAVAAEARRLDIDWPILLDGAQGAARALGVTHTAEAIVIDPDGWRIRYRGPAGPPLRAALEAVLADRPVARPRLAAPGRAIHVDADAPVSYARDVAPILERRCRDCHRDGGPAPWRMTDHATVRGWSPMMGEVLRTGRMPPWQADPHVGRFADDLGLPDVERATLLRWIEAGAPRGDGPDPLAEHPAAPVPEWPLGPPDLVVEASERRLPPTGVIPYLYESVEIPVEGERWVRAVDLRPSNAAVLHHALVWIDYPGDEHAPRTEGPRFTRGMLAGYVPGRRMRPFPEGTGYRLPAGSKLYFQLHYTATGRPESDRPRLGLYFADGPLAYELRTGAAASFDFEIPPRAADHEETAVRVLDRDVVLYRMTPHMHYRGKRMRIDARFPDGHTETLLSVPRYDFNWQHQYVLDPPRRLPKGTAIEVTAGFDNSARNPANPDPDVPVHYGEQSYEEMLFGYFLYREDPGGATRVAGPGQPMARPPDRP